MSSYAIMTNTGRNKEAEALANGTGLAITEIAWGDGDRFSAGGETALLNETGRKAVQGTGLVDGALNTAFFEILLDANEGPFVIREAGLFDAEGDLIAIAKYDPPVNKPKDSVTALIRIHVVFSDLENLILKVQSTDAYVPVERKIIAGTGLIGGGDMSADRSFAVAFASEAEALAGAQNDKAMSPATVAAKVNAALNALLDGAPGALDTLNELAAALGDDPDFAATVLKKINIAAPAGAIMAFAMSEPPEGWLECNGALISKAYYAELYAVIGITYGGNDFGGNFRIPDLRGEFLRGWDHGRGVDSGRLFGSAQAATAIRTLIDNFNGYGVGTYAIGMRNHDGPITGGGSDSNTFGKDNEYYSHTATTRYGSGDNAGYFVRPRNVALMFCIKY